MKKPDTAAAGSLCINCGAGAQGNYLYPGILRCPSCNLVFADITLSREEAVRLYSKDYFNGNEYLNYAQDAEVFHKNFRLRIDTLRNFSQGGKLFEIGCAYGFFLDEARNFWSAAGCDLSREACESARSRGHDVRDGEFLELPLEEGAYDAVVLWDTVEHLTRPDLYLEKASRLLRKGGVLALTTGDIGSVMARLRGARWRIIHPPTHLYYFDRQTMGKLLERVGIEIIHFEHCGFYRSLRQILYSLLFLNREKREGPMGNAGGPSIYLNLYDIMMVVGRKR